MKKKQLKGFTLIELIVVMAIIGIIMVAMMNLFKPIRTTFVDSTLYENQRTVENGMSQYIGESTRCSTRLGIYSTLSSAKTVNGTSYSITDEDSAIAAFCAQMNITPTPADKNYKTIHVITIDMKNSTSNTHIYKNNYYNGLLYMYRWDATATPAFRSYVALGDAYYGKNNFSTSIVPDLTSSAGVALNIAVATTNTDGTVITTKDSTALKNISNTLTKLDLKFFQQTPAAGPNPATYFSTTGVGSSTYIVYTVPN